MKRGLGRRQVTATPTGIPAYATPCPDASAYASACSCWGITAATTTLEAPTQTVTAYAMVTAAPACANPGNCDGGGNFEIVACPGFESGSCTCGGDVDNVAFCFGIPAVGCGAPKCFANADCAAGARCLVRSCCTDLQPGQGLCVTVADNGVCGNPDAVLPLMARRWAEARGARRGLECGLATKC